MSPDRKRRNGGSSDFTGESGAAVKNDTTIGEKALSGNPFLVTVETAQPKLELGEMLVNARATQPKTMNCIDAGFR